MKICTLRILILISLSTVGFAGITAVMNSQPSISLMPGAFWIKNHWQHAEDGYAEKEPVHWRTAASHQVLVSGSAIHSVGNMKWLNKKYGNQYSVYILDLRQETHLYINGLPMSIFYKKDQINWSKPSDQIRAEEQKWIASCRTKDFLTIHTLGKPQKGLKTATSPQQLIIQDLFNEETVAHQAGLGYFRIDVPDYHPPSPQHVDAFLAFVHRLPQNAWLHIHCAAGKGRTTTFMIMKDMITHAKNTPLEVIVTRHHDLGGIHLFKASPSHQSQPWKKEYHEGRIYFIKLFYNYMRSESYPSELFSVWLKKQPLTPYQALLQTPAYVKQPL